MYIQAGFEPTCKSSQHELQFETCLAKSQNLKYASLALCPFTIWNYKILYMRGAQILGAWSTKFCLVLPDILSVIIAVFTSHTKLC